MHEIWRSGFIRRSAASLLERSPQSDEVVWLPCDGDFRFLADPFGMERDGVLTVFVEAFDYRTRRGEIHFCQYDALDRLVGRGLALAESWHLSYPFLIEEQGELFLLPEASKSGGLTLYRCARFPDRWEPYARLLNVPAIDATIVRHGGHLWMFYALPGPDNRSMREMHIAHASRIEGPWLPHRLSPALTGLDTSRPGGSPFVRSGALHLPVQDCRGSYGAAINVVRVDALCPETFQVSPAGRLEGAGLSPEFSDGLHTLSGSGAFSFLDVKSLRTSPREGWVKAQAKTRRLLGLGRPGEAVPTPARRRAF